MHPKPVRVAIAVMANGPSMVSVGLMDLLRKSSHWAVAQSGGKARPLHVELVGATRTVKGAGGFKVPCDATFAQGRRYDLVVVTSIDADEVSGLTRNADAARWVKTMYRAGADVISVCIGAFVLAEAGLLNGRKATTHWAFQDALASRFPKVRIEPQAVIVDEGRICTAGGATSFINLALYWVERLLGKDTATAASKMFLIDVNKAPQGAYAIFSTQKIHGDDEILQAQAMMEGEGARTDSVAQIARKVAMSPRTFVRRFKQATGNTPREYAQRARVEVAKRALESSRQPLSSVAQRVGYSDVVAFRKIFARFTGLNPADYRRRYSNLA